MPWYAKLTFSSSYGTCIEKKDIKATLTSKPPKAVIEDWAKNDLIAWVKPSEGEEGTLDELDEMEPPTKQETRTVRSDPQVPNPPPRTN